MFMIPFKWYETTYFTTKTGYTGLIILYEQYKKIDRDTKSDILL